MSSFEKIFEGMQFLWGKRSRIHKFVAVSGLRRFLVLSGVTILLIGAQYVYLNLYLAAGFEKNGQNRNREITDLQHEINYKFALDTISLCLDSTKEKADLHAWYCEQAIAQYESRSKERVKDRVDEIIKRRAYGTMKIDVSHYLRDLESNRLVNSPVPLAEKLNVALSPIVITLGLIFVVTVLTSLSWWMWMQPRPQKEISDGNAITKSISD